MLTTVQPFLEPRKGAPALTVSRGGDGDLHVFLGLAYLECVSGESESFQRKLLVARLYNAGHPVTELSQKFQAHRRTISGWGKAIRSGDPQVVARVFSGRGGLRKVTVQMRSFIVARYGELRSEGVRDYRRCIVQEVTRYFGESVSGECIRRIILTESGRGPRGVSGNPDGAQGRVQNGCSSRDDSSTVLGTSSNSSAPNGVPAAGGLIPFSGCPAPVLPRYVHHAGQVLFSPWLDEVFRSMSPALPELRQWTAQVLQGAVVIEQTRDVDVGCLSLFTGPMLECRRAQRRHLRVLSRDEKVAAAMLAGNSRVLRSPLVQCTCFYYDPHTKAYTGGLEFLEGWCGSLHAVCAVINMDFIHTRDGDPCVVMLADSYFDLRERVPQAVELLRGLLPGGGAELVLVIDRAIYGLDAFARLLAAGLRLITWEKGYKPGGWEGEAHVQFTLLRTRNDSQDVITLHVEAQERLWRRDPTFRQILVRKVVASGQPQEEISVLCNASAASMPTEEAARLMLNRWIQENDFRLLDTHFGIRQITSYASESYAELADELEDRPAASPEYKSLRREAQQTQRDLEKQLFRLERMRDTCAALQSGLSDPAEMRERLEQALEKLKSRQLPAKAVMAVCRAAETACRHSRARRHVQRKLAKLQPRVSRLQAQIDSGKARLASAEELLRDVERTDSKLRLLIGQKKRRPDMRAKYLMDTVRVTGRNVFCRLASVFREFYDNRRDDYAILRLLTQAPGQVLTRDGVVTVRLFPRATLPLKTRRQTQRFLLAMSERINRHFAGRASPVRVLLG